MTQNYTPGPWQINDMRRFELEKVVIQSSEDGGIAELSPDRSGGELQYDLGANADLIAAAPELFEALIDVMANINHPKGWDPIHPTCQAAMRDAETAIAKARGNGA